MPCSLTSIVCFFLSTQALVSSCCRCKSNFYRPVWCAMSTSSSFSSSYRRECSFEQVLCFSSEIPASFVVFIAKNCIFCMHTCLWLLHEATCKHLPSDAHNGHPPLYSWLQLSTCLSSFFYIKQLKRTILIPLLSCLEGRFASAGTMMGKGIEGDVPE